MTTRTWKVYGMYNGEQHRQKMSFTPSKRYDWTKDGNVRIVELLNSDITGTNDFTLVRITRNTAEECERELDGQLSDGLFENVRTGEVVEVFA